MGLLLVGANFVEQEAGNQRKAEWGCSNRKWAQHEA